MTVKSPIVWQPPDANGTLQALDEGQLVEGVSAIPDNFEESPDDWCIAYWLTASASKSGNTKRSYQKEVRRWRAFLCAIRGDLDDTNLLRTATYAHATSFLAWIKGRGEPALPEVIGERFGMSKLQLKRPKNSKVVLRQAVVILHGLYEELCAAVVPRTYPPERACAANPFKPYRKHFGRGTAKSRKQKGPDKPGVAKALSDTAWALVWEVACELPEKPHLRLRAARRRLMLAMLRGTWERRTLVADATWADLQPDSNGIWKLAGLRKGDDDVTWRAVPPALVAEVTTFRRTVGLPPFPGPEEAGRSLYYIGGRSAGHDGPIGDVMLYREVKKLFKEAAARLHESDPANAAALRRAGSGPHTIRHTMATQFMRGGGDPRIAQELLGHSSLAVTTGTYDTREEREQVDALQWQWQQSGTD